MKTTIKKISEIAGVSRGTVDRVLNNRPGVKLEVKEKIIEIIKEVGYEPNIAGKALAYSKKPVVFGIIMPPKEIKFFDCIREGINAAWEELKGINIKLEFRYVSNRNPEESVTAIKELKELGVSGIMYSVMDDTIIKEAINEVTNIGIPVVTFNSDVKDSKRICFVGQDLYKSGRVAAGLMCKVLNKGSNVVVVTGNLLFQAHEARVKGFVDKVKEMNNCLNVVDVIQSYDSYDETYRSLGDVLTNPKYLLTEQDNIKGIYMATGDIGACLDIQNKLNLNKKMHIIANDLISEAVEGIKSGVVDFTITQNPYLQGYKPLRILYEYVFLGRKPASDCYFTENSIIMDENIAF